MSRPEIAASAIAGRRFGVIVYSPSPVADSTVILTMPKLRTLKSGMSAHAARRQPLGDARAVLVVVLTVVVGLAVLAKRFRPELARASPARFPPNDSTSAPHRPMARGDKYSWRWTLLEAVHMMKSFAMSSLWVAALSLCPACSGGEDKSKIVIGQATSLTGDYATGAAMTYLPIYDMWVDEVNANGGIYVSAYGKKLPVELKREDDASSITAMKFILEKMMAEDKVDFVLPPWGTDMLYEAAPLVNSYGYVLIGGPAGAVTLMQLISGLPYVFAVLNFSDTQVPALANVLASMGVHTAAVSYVQDLYGMESFEATIAAFATAGINVASMGSYPLGTTDFSTFFTQAGNAEAFVSFSYPNESFAMTGQAKALNFNPKVYYNGVGVQFAAYRDANSGAEGVFGPCGWNPKSTVGAKDFYDRYVARWQQSPTVQAQYPGSYEPDYWGGLTYYSSLQFLGQAIEKAGSLDQKAIRDIFASQTFDTAMGPMYFVNGRSGTSPGELCQWQKGVYEVLAPADKKTGSPIYPKPAW